MRQMFDHCTDITSLDLSSFNTSNVTNMSLLFAYCRNLAYLNISGWDFSKSNRTPSQGRIASMFSYCDKLTNVVGPVTGINDEIDFTYSPLLSHDSAMVFINGLEEAKDDGYVHTYQIRFTTNTYNTLSAEEIKIATDKGWTVKAQNNY